MTTEVLGPTATVSAGMAVEVMPRSNDGRVPHGSGVLAEFSGFSVFVETLHCPWSPGDEVIVACGPLGNRVGALARFREQRRQKAVFVRQSPWRPLNRRAFERFPAELAAKWASSDDWKPGVVADVSHGGLALVVTSEPSADAVRVQLDSGSGTVTLVGNVVGRSGSMPATVLHLEFDELSPEADAFLGNLVTRLAMSLGTDTAGQ